MLFKNLFLKVKREKMVRQINSETHSNFSKKTYLSNSRVEGYCASRGDVNIKGSFLGIGTYIGNNSRLTNCKIGRFCSIGTNCSVVECKHPTSIVSTYPVFYNDVPFLPLNLRKNTGAETFNVTMDGFNAIIGNDVWIGNNVLLKGGITIGDGAIIGMGSVVTKDVPPYAIVAGNPAKLIRYRFENDIIEKLLSIKWWNWDKDKILKNSNLFLDVKSFTNIFIKK